MSNPIAAQILNILLMLKRIFKFTKTMILIGTVGLFSIWLIDNWVQRTASTAVFSEINDVPNNKVGLLLGTRKILASGYQNLYYSYRIEAAEKLFKAGKIKFILISGDNSKKEYDEPTDMRDDLIARGIPIDKIYLDYAGFRTLDSVVRADKIFGQKELTIISQPFHNERAIFISNKKGIKSVGFNAKDVSARYGFKTMLREKLARVKMLLDLTFGVQPKFLGKQIEII